MNDLIQNILSEDCVLNILYIYILIYLSFNKMENFEKHYEKNLSRKIHSSADLSNFNTPANIKQ